MLLVHHQQKLWNIFHFSDFLHHCGAWRVFLWHTFLRANITFWGANSQLTAKWKAKFQNCDFGLFFCIRLCLEFLSSHCQMSAISDRVLYKDIVNNTIVYLLPIWCDQQGIIVVGASCRRKLGVGLVCHKVMFTKPYPVTNSRSIHRE